MDIFPPAHHDLSGQKSQANILYKKMKRTLDK